MYKVGKKVSSFGFRVADKKRQDKADVESTKNDISLAEAQRSQRKAIFRFKDLKNAYYLTQRHEAAKKIIFGLLNNG